MSIRSIAKKILFRLFGRRIFMKAQYWYWRYNLLRGKKTEPETRILSRIVRAGDCVLDIGAHFGRYTVPLSRLVGANGTVYAIEAVESTFQILSRLVSSLRLDNVKSVQCAFSNIACEQWIVTPRDAVGLEISSLSHLSTGKEEGKSPSIVPLRQRIETITVDDFFQSLAGKRITFIKCDVEGAELLVFQGATQLLNRDCPVVLCEIQAEHTQRYGYTPADLVLFMRNLGYGLYTLSGDSLVPCVAVTQQTNNYFFVHETNRAMLE